MGFCPCQIRFRSRVAKGAKHRAGFGRCEASFLTLWEETLHTCPKPSPATSDGTTTLLDDKTFNFFSLSSYYLTKLAREQEAMVWYLPLLSQTWWQWRPPPLVRNHAKTWWGHGRHWRKNICGKPGLVRVDKTQRTIKKHVYSFKKHTFCQRACWSAACRTKSQIDRKI